MATFDPVTGALRHVRSRGVLAWTGALLLTVAAACASADGDAAVVFGAHGPEVARWAEAARENRAVDLVTRRRVNGQNVYERVGPSELEAHVRSSEYVLVRRRLTSDQWAELRTSAETVWPELAGHVRQHVLERSGDPAPAGSDSPIVERSEELLHRPRELGGFGAAIIGGAGFVLPVVTPDMRQAASRADRGEALSSRDQRLSQLHRIRRILIEP